MLFTHSIFFSSFKDNVNKLRKMSKIEDRLNVLKFGFEHDIDLRVKL